MALDQKIVVHFKDGKIWKGTSHDFSPGKDSFHLTVTGQLSHQKPIEIKFSELKAIFFVKDFTGNKDYQVAKSFADASKSAYGKKAIVRCKDGEVMYGFIQGYAPNRPGFFLFPVDSKDNNLKIFILQTFMAQVDFPE